MLIGSLLRTAIAVFALLLAQAIGSPSAVAQEAQALTGTVSSAEEGAMEGVIVSAKKDGSTITVSVISDEQGHYSFPAARLAPGAYKLSIRAVGYELDSADSAEVAGRQRRAASDLKLGKTTQPGTQLTNTEWMMSVPGTDDDKLRSSIASSCHTLERIVKSTLQCRRVRTSSSPRMSTYAQVQPADQAAAALSIRSRALESGTRSASAAEFSPDQSERSAALGLRAQDPAARQRAGHHA